jgi:phospholipase/lecithinase/hemolysin
LSYQVLLYAQASPPPLLYAQASPPPPSNRALYVIVSGANDYLSGTLPFPDMVVGNIQTAVGSLYQLGARNIMVQNLPNLGTIPLVAGYSAAQRAGLTALSAAHNAALASALDTLKTALPGINLILVDVNQVLQTLPPGTNLTVPAVDALVPAPLGQTPNSFCLFTNPATCPNVPTFDVGLEYLFWDAEHPTTAIHRRLAQQMYGELTE